MKHKKTTIDPNDVLQKPRVTEKSAVASERGVYSFEVDPRATKSDVMDAMHVVFKVTPVKVNITRYRTRTTSNRGRNSTKPGYKKAVVYLKEGDKIELV